MKRDQALDLSAARGVSLVPGVKLRGWGKENPGDAVVGSRDTSNNMAINGDKVGA